jgi:hypothetical protein
MLAQTPLRAAQGHNHIGSGDYVGTGVIESDVDHEGKVSQDAISVVKHLLTQQEKIAAHAEAQSVLAEAANVHERPS